MLPLFIYILKAILVSGLLLGYYWIGLRNTRFHYYNRFYLVGAVLLSLVMPLLDLQWFKFYTPESISVQQAVQFIYKSEGIVTGEQGFTWQQLLGLSIAMISAVLLIMFGLGIIKIYLIKSKGKVTVMERFDFIETVIDDAPFSFFRNLFWRKGLPIEDETSQRMLKHELTHIEQLHSFDKLFISLATFLFWVNPFFWIIRKELEVVHEFIADEEAVAGDDATVLAKMLLKAHYHSNSLSVGQSFFYSSIKRRIIMLTTSKKVSYSYTRRLLILPVAIGILILTSFTIKDSLSDAQSRQMDQSAIRASKLDTIPAKYRDAKTGKIRGSFRIDIDGDMASFKDVKSKKELFKVPLSELSGPANKVITVQGFPMDMSKKVMFLSGDSSSKSEFVFITDGSSMPETPPMPPMPPLEPGKLGTTRIIINGKEVSPTELDKLDPTIIKTIDIKGDEKVAPKVIMLKIDTAKLNQNTMTISTSDDKIAEKIESDPSTLTFTTTDKDGKKTYTFVKKTTEKSEWPKDVLFIIDGKEMQSESMKDIDPTTIKSINVLKGETAVKLYGEKGKKGVVEITTKK